MSQAYRLDRDHGEIGSAKARETGVPDRPSRAAFMPDHGLRIRPAATPAAGVRIDDPRSRVLSFGTN
jgi:hypothetical protein